MKSASEAMLELRSLGGPGSGRYPKGSKTFGVNRDMTQREAHKAASNEHSAAASAHKDALVVKSRADMGSQDSNYRTYATEARVASIQAQGHTAATGDTTANGLAHMAREASKQNDHSEAIRYHTTAMRAHDKAAKG